MRTAHYPTPAELDAYAKKVANNPLTIKIFPNSVKVPQRKHVRRTVNGLDTSAQRYSPYPTQAATKAGLLAIVKVPARSILKDFDGTRARLLPEALAHQGLQHPPNPLLHGGRKMPDSDAPPNVTVSTSTIPLSMAATLQHSQPPDLSSIVHQINQFCQTRAGISTTSVCEGQIANPSPISRSLLINASTRVSTHSVPTPMPSCVVNPMEHTHVATAALPVTGPVNLPTGISRAPTGYPSDLKSVAWNQHQLAHLQQMCSEAGGTPAAAGLTGKHAAGLNGLAAPLAYPNGHYFQPLWNNILPTPNSDSSGSQDLTMPFHGGQPTGAPLDCAAAAGAHYRAATGGGPVASQNSLMQTVDYLSGDFQQACFREQSLAMLSKAHRAPGSRAPDPTDSRSLHIQHPGYR
uniref:Family with sequence similarity 222 member B n=1 Tax=Loxodonta africana TaxID=9785 RepID=G3UIL6_LOXAF